MFKKFSIIVLISFIFSLLAACGETATPTPGSPTPGSPAVGSPAVGSPAVGSTPALPTATATAKVPATVVANTPGVTIVPTSANAKPLQLTPVTAEQALANQAIIATRPEGAGMAWLKVATSQADLNWKGTEALPTELREIDWQSELLIAPMMVAGPTSVYGLKLKKAELDGTTVTIQVEITIPAPGTIVPAIAVGYAVPAILDRAQLPKGQLTFRLIDQANKLLHTVQVKL